MNDKIGNAPASSPSGDPYLLTPGPLTTSLSVKQAMLHDYGSRDATFIELNARILERLVDIVAHRVPPVGRTAPTIGGAPGMPGGGTGGPTTGGGGTGAVRTG